MRSGPGGTTASPSEPVQIADYRIERRVGVGGMGVVYLAFDERLGRNVALKVMSPELANDASFRRRFMRESRLAASIGHPNVVPIFRAGEEEGVLFLVMPYIEGPDLGTVLRGQGAMDPGRALGIAKQVAAALDAAHRAGLVHRDVKPANVLLQPGGRSEPEHCYLTDFGLTKQSSGGSGGMTRTGELLGTPNYMAPEQIRGDQVGAAADTYALGCLIFEALTGRPPYPRATEAAVLAAHVYDPPPSARALRPELPPAIDQVIGRALAKDPGSRHSSCGSLAAATAAALTGTADGEDRAVVPPAFFSTAARTRPQPYGDRTENRRPPVPPPNAGGPTVAKQGRGPLLPAAIVGIAILLCAGAIVGALALKGSSRMSASDLAEAQRLIDRTTLINARLARLAEKVQGGSKVDSQRLTTYRNSALILGRDVRTNVSNNDAIRDSLIAANARLAAAATALQAAAAGNSAALQKALHDLRVATARAKAALDALQQAKSKGSGGGGGSSPKVSPGKAKPVPTVPIHLPSGAAFTIAPPGSGSISSLAAAGDVNGDGDPDLLVGTTGERATSTSYALFGGRGGGTLALDRVGARGIEVSAGERAYPAGDLNRDGKDDILVADPVSEGGPAFVYAVAGRRASGQIDPTVDALATIAVSDAGSRCSGHLTAGGAGDVNGDGSPDVFVAAPCAGDGGTAWVIFGPWTAGAQLDVSSLGSQGLEIDGPAASGDGGLGFAADGGQDVNGDRKDDLVLGEPDAAGGSATYVVFGTDGPGPIQTDQLGSGGYALTGGTELGHAVVALGDTTGDGRSEIVVTDPAATTGRRSGSGAAYVVFGGGSSADRDVTALGSRGFRIVGPAASTGTANPSGLGTSAAAGDVNGDGTPDVVLGSPGLKSPAGVAYAVYGRKGSTSDVDLAHLGSAGAVIDDEAPVTSAVVGSGANLDGRGASDVVVALAGADGRATGYVVGISR